MARRDQQFRLCPELFRQTRRPYDQGSARFRREREVRATAIYSEGGAGGEQFIRLHSFVLQYLDGCDRVVFS
jgi:hypothetical protein